MGKAKIILDNLVWQIHGLMLDESRCKLQLVHNKPVPKHFFKLWPLVRNNNKITLPSFCRILWVLHRVEMVKLPTFRRNFHISRWAEKATRSHVHHFDTVRYTEESRIRTDPKTEMLHSLSDLISLPFNVLSSTRYMRPIHSYTNNRLKTTCHPSDGRWRINYKADTFKILPAAKYAHTLCLLAYDSKLQLS
jgi:hypothetical protein